MGKITCVCISSRRKTSAQNVHQCSASPNGLVGDVHYGLGQKQVSLLPYDTVKEYFDRAGEPIRYGRFGENLVVRDIAWNALQPGCRLSCGEVILEVVKIGAGGPASDAYTGEKVCSPMEPYFVFCRVRQGGILRENESITLWEEKR